MKRLFLSRVLCCALALSTLGFAAALPARAALPPVDDTTATQRLGSSPAVLRAQEALSRLGFYLGPKDGRLDGATRAAVKIYQRAIGLEPTGEISLDLLRKMEYAVGVRRLMRQLEEARSESIRDARSKLLDHPATRSLVRDGDKTETADPTRDPTPCFDNPTALCLLNEASESAKAITKADLRDWALGEILIAEARAGLGERAMKTAARINDPRLVMVALRDIAEAQAAAGRHTDAMTAAEIIPDPEKQADAISAIAEIQVRRGEKDIARESASRLLVKLGDVPDRLRQIAFRTRAAVIFAAADAQDIAENQLTIAEADASGLPRDSSRSAGLRYVAAALADMHDVARALQMLEGVSRPADRVPVLMSAAEAQAETGDVAAALATANSIESIRYRALALGRIALAHAAAGRLQEADTTLEIARAAIDRIDRPYARSYAISRIALALSRLLDWAPDASSAARAAALSKALETAAMIEDQRLKAHTLWSIAARQRALGEGDVAKTESAAQAATDQIVGAHSRVWLFADLAEGHARGGQEAAAWQAFERAIAIARTIENAWSRARTLAKLAATLIGLVDPGTGRADAEP